MTDGHEPINMDLTPYGSLGGYYGLNKREYFAAMAMQGLCAMNDKGISVETSEEAWGILASHSVVVAEALIKALNKNGYQDNLL